MGGTYEISDKEYSQLEVCSPFVETPEMPFRKRPETQTGFFWKNAEAPYISDFFHLQRSF